MILFFVCFSLRAFARFSSAVFLSLNLEILLSIFFSFSFFSSFVISTNPGVVFILPCCFDCQIYPVIVPLVKKNTTQKLPACRKSGNKHHTKTTCILQNRYKSGGNTGGRKSISHKRQSNDGDHYVGILAKEVVMASLLWMHLMIHSSVLTLAKRKIWDSEGVRLQANNQKDWFEVPDSFFFEYWYGCFQLF